MTCSAVVTFCVGEEFVICASQEIVIYVAGVQWEKVICDLKGRWIFAYSEKFFPLEIAEVNPCDVVNGSAPLESDAPFQLN